MKETTKFLSVIMALTVAISCMLISGTLVSADVSVADDSHTVTYWDGKASNGFVKTDHITNASELRYVLTDSTYRGANHTVFIDNDIWVNPITVTSAGDMYDLAGENLIMSADGTLAEGYSFDASHNILDADGIVVRNWAHSVEGFCGIINGNGHTINGLYMYSEASRRGLINNLYSNTNSTFNALGFENSYVTTTTGNASVLLGDINFANNVTIDKCYIGDTVYVNAALKANGFMCYGAANQVLSVSNCYVTANLAGATEDAIGGGVWNIKTSTYTNIYTTSATVNAPGTYSNLIKSATTASNFSALGDAFYTPAAGGLPKLMAFYKGAKVTPVWDGTTATKPAIGAGSSDDPYIISTPNELYWALVAGGDANRNNKYYKLSCDIVLNDITVDKDGNIYNAEGALVTDANAAGITKWNVTSATAFYGTIDGNGYAVKGVYVNGSGGSNGAGLALIPTHNSAGALTISNFGMEDSYIKNSNGRAAALVQFANTGKALNLNQIFIEDSVYVSGTSYASGLVGYGDFTNYKFSNNIIFASLNATKKGAVSANIWGTWSGSTMPAINHNLANTGFGSDLSGTNADGRYNYKVDTPDALTDTIVSNLGSAFYAVAGDYPMLHVRGTAIGDVDENGIGAQANDITELRKTLIEVSAWENTDYNRDTLTDVCDLVALSKKK